MSKLLKIDLVLITLTILGLIYLYSKNSISYKYAFFILSIYIFAKVAGYIILPYNKFEEFIKFLTETSKISNTSGFEIFKITLVILLYLGFVFLDPAIWIIESILVVMMRIWGVYYQKHLTKINETNKK